MNKKKIVEDALEIGRDKNVLEFIVTKHIISKTPLAISSILI